LAFDYMFFGKQNYSTCYIGGAHDIFTAIWF